MSEALEQLISLCNQAEQLMRDAILSGQLCGVSIDKIEEAWTALSFAEEIQREHEGAK